MWASEHVIRRAVCSAKFALRPYLYLLLHWPIVKIAAIATGSLSGPRFIPFYALRFALALLSSFLDIRLARCARLM